MAASCPARSKKQAKSGIQKPLYLVAHHQDVAHYRRRPCVEQPETKCPVVVAQEGSQFAPAEQSTKRFSMHYRQVVLGYQLFPKYPNEEIVYPPQIGDRYQETPTRREHIEMLRNNAFNVCKMFDEPVGHDDIEMSFIHALKLGRQKVSLDDVIATYAVQLKQLSV